MRSVHSDGEDAAGIIDYNNQDVDVSLQSAEEGKTTPDDGRIPVLHKLMVKSIWDTPFICVSFDDMKGKGNVSVFIARKAGRATMLPNVCII